MTSDTPIAKSQKGISSWKAGHKTHVKLQTKKSYCKNAYLK